MDATNPPLRIRRRLIAAAAGAAAYLASRLLALAPERAGALYGETIAATVVPALSRMTGVVPFAVAEVLAAGYLAWRAWTVGRALYRVRRGKRTPGNALAGGALVTLRDLGLAVLLFYLLWGFHYARGPVAERIGLPSLEEVRTGQVHALAAETVRAANGLYLELHGTEDDGAPTAGGGWRAASRSLERGWEVAVDRLGLPAHTAATYGPPKPLALSPVLVRLGLVGFYVPWTAEAIVNGEVPAVLRGRSAAHEQAHQRGVTSEGEATFVGWVAAVHSGDALVRYSAVVDAQLRLLALLDARDRDAARELAARRLPGVARDLRDLARFRERMRGPASEAATRVNDAYLRANRVEGGVRSYATATALLLRYARARGGSLALEADPRPAGPAADAVN